MNTMRDRRRVALQVMYQFDRTGDQAQEPDVRSSLHASLETPELDADTIDAGIAMAEDAWKHVAAADAAIEPLTPDWPMRRQPVIDRNLLRLAWYEMHVAGTPPKVVISESVDIAREFSTDQSPNFINGVLDRLFHDMQGDQQETPSGESVG